jgi:aminoglycoside phosphotransferase family enzyme/predicted kinase
MVDLRAHLSELLRPEAFTHRATDIQLRETHISWIILAGEYAYKIRKPVNFGFLDFSSVEKRLADCEAEVALNRRLCPDLYLGVVYVVECDGRLAVGGRGRQIEPAVQMRRLPESAMLPNLLQRHAADARSMERIAHQLADFHAVARTGSEVNEYGSTGAICANWDENFGQTANCPEDVLPASHRAAIHNFVETFLAANATQFQQRVGAGRVRDGHGDLHAGSVCLLRRRVYLFDCIEFNARFRCADVAAEVAFLAMDLDHYGRADLSHAFVSAYVRYSGDRGLLQLLAFYKCYRAYVRGKVLAFRLADRQLDAAERECVTRDAHAYIDLALTYAQPLARPVLVLTMGLPASGKTTLARNLAARLALVHLSSDIVRKSLVGMRPVEHAADAYEQGLYTRRMSQRTYSMLRRMAARWLRRGQSVVVDATYGKPAERAALRQVARGCGACLVVVVCRAGDALLQARLAARENDRDSVSDARLALWPALRRAYVEPTEMPDALQVDTSQPIGQVLEQVLAAVIQK